VLVALTWAPAPVCAETFCKWVDADGVTHYAARCPRDIDGRMLDVDAPPDWRDDEEPGAAETEAPSEAGPGREPRTAEDLDAAAREAARKRADDACAEALRQLDELSTALPVYRDDDGAVHADETLHHWWYRGPRTYLDGPERRAVFARVQAEAARLCGQRIDGERPPVPLFTRAPLPRDVIPWLEQPATAPAPPAQLCPYATRLARNLRRDRPTDPTDDMRRLDEALLEGCPGR
jgi:hypothetical protein